MKTPHALNRRQILRGLGGATLAVPLLPSLVPAFARRALAAEVRKNFISYRIVNGYYGHQWYPTDAAIGGPRGLALVAPNVREMRLSDINGPISTLLDAQFDRFRGKMNLLRHIDRLDKSDHDYASGLLGWSVKGSKSGDFLNLPPSIDRLMADKVFRGTVQPLNLSVRWSTTGASCSVSPTGQGGLDFGVGLYPEQAYQKLFGNWNMDPVTAMRRRGYKHSIVDRVLPHYQAVRDNPRLSALDRAVLDQHIEHMHTLSQQLAQPMVACVPAGAPEAFMRQPEQIDAAAEAHVNIAVAALRCGLTRIVNFYFDPDSLFSPDLHGVEGGHHGASHDPMGGKSIENVHRWYMRYLARFLARMDDMTDPATGSTLLDQSLVFVNNEIGNQNGQSGNQPDDIDINHLGVDVQTLLIGSCGGALRTGKFLDYRTDYRRSRYSQYIGTAYNRVLVSCMLAMGLQPGDWEMDGKPGYGDLRGGIQDTTPLDKVVIGDLRSYLPRLARG